jgi:hypothetical protein
VRQILFAASFVALVAAILVLQPARALAPGWRDARRRVRSQPVTCSDGVATKPRTVSFRNCRYAYTLMLLGAAGIGGCKGPQCENEAFFGLPSPDGASIAFVFHRKCAENNAITTDVTVLDFHSPLRNEPGNVLAVGNEQPVRVSWLGPHKLVVTGFKEPVSRRNARVGSITIEFRQAALTE